MTRTAYCPDFATCCSMKGVGWTGVPRVRETTIAEDPVRRGRPNWWDHVRRTASQLQRLEPAIAATTLRIEARHEVLGDAAAGRRQCACEDETLTPQIALATAAELLRQSRVEHGRGDPDAGWARLHEAEEFECLALGRHELDARIVDLSASLGTSRYGGLPDAVIRELLPHLPRCDTDPRSGSAETTEQSLVIDRMRLRQAWHVRNEYLNTRYYVVRVSAIRRLMLLGIGLAIAGAIWRLLHVAHPALTGADGSRAWALVLGLLAGGIGAVVSAVQRLATHPVPAMPAELDSLTATLTRPFIGAVAAATVYLAWRGGFVVFPDDHPIALFVLACFGVGFTERLVVYHPPQAVSQPR